MANYQDSKHRFQKNNRNNDKVNRYRANVPVFYVKDVGSFTPNGIKFDIESLDDILASLNDSNAFRMMSHPVSMKKSDVFTDIENARGNVTVGYIRNITDNGDIAVTINVRYIDAFKRIKEPTIQVNGIVKDGLINTILSFIIGDYNDIYESSVPAEEVETIDPQEDTEVEE